MKATDLLVAVRQCGVEMQADGDRLRYRPPGRVPPALQAALKEHKRELLAELQIEQALGTGACVLCAARGMQQEGRQQTPDGRSWCDDHWLIPADATANPDVLAGEEGVHLPQTRSNTRTAPDLADDEYCHSCSQPVDRYTPNGTPSCKAHFAGLLTRWVGVPTIRSRHCASLADCSDVISGWIVYRCQTDAEHRTAVADAEEARAMAPQPGLDIRWGRARGWLVARDLATGDVVEIKAKDAPTGWAREASQRKASRRMRRAA